MGFFGGGMGAVGRFEIFGPFNGVKSERWKKYLHMFIIICDTIPIMPKVTPEWE